MEVQHDDHLAVAGLEYGVLDVVVEDVHFIAAYWRETETWRDSRLWLTHSGQFLTCKRGVIFIGLQTFGNFQDWKCGKLPLEIPFICSEAALAAFDPKDHI